MIRSYPDGSTIELAVGNTHPPGWRGQHGNVDRPWARMDGGDWKPADGARSMHKLREWIEAAETAVEAFEIICPAEEAN